MLSRLSLCILLLVSIHPAVHADEPYRIGSDDVLRIQVWPRSDLGAEVSVDASGNVALPLLGSVAAAGKTATELGQELLGRYQILDPSISEVFVNVAQYLSQRVTVVGEVRNPGKYTFRKIPGLWDVLLGAGGATPNADMSAVQISRKEREAGEPQAVTVDLSGGLEGTDPDKLPKLRTDDTILVPSLAGEHGGGEEFQILGSVRTPGVYRLGSAGTVVEALALSGGPLPDADLSKVRLTRPTDSGVVAYRLDIKGHLYEGKPLSDMKLRAGDTVTVPGGSGGISLGSVFGEVLKFTSIITAVSSLVVALNR